MASIHFVCRERQNLRILKLPVYESGDWDLTPEEAETLFEGMICLHQTKASQSYFRGKILDFHEVETENARSRRVVFTFTFVPACKGAKWHGADHSKAWTSGIIPDQHEQN